MLVSRAFSSLAVSLVVINATALAIFWAHLTPVLSAPGEAFAYDRIVTLSRSEAPLDERNHSRSTFDNADVAAVVAFTGASALAADGTKRIVRGYGSAEYFRELDAVARSPRPNRAAAIDKPIVSERVTAYDVLAELILRACTRLTSSFSVQFFAVRLVGCVMLGAALALSYLLLTRIGVSSVRSLATIAIVSVLPATTATSSCVGPCSFIWMLLSAIWLVSVGISKAYKNIALFGLLVALLGVMGATDQFYLLVAAVSVTPFLMLTAHGVRSRYISAFVGAGTVLWVIISHASSSPHVPLIVQAHGIDAPLSDITAQLSSFASLMFGLAMPSTTLALGMPALAAPFETLLDALFVLIAVLLIRYGGSAIGEAQRRWARDRAAALRAVLGDPLVVAYAAVVVTALALVAANPHRSIPPALVVPVLVPMILMATCGVFSRLPSHTPRVIATGFALATALFCCFFATQAAYARFYVDLPQRGAPIALDRFPYVLGTDHTLADFAATTPAGTEASLSPLLRGSALRISGWAVDSIDAAPPRAVYVSVDDLVFVRAQYGEARPDVAAALHDDVFLRSGFSATFPLDSLRRGVHRISIRVIGPDGRIALPSVMVKAFTLQ